MWLPLLIGAVLRLTEAGSISGSSTKSKFPVELEAAEGDPVPGEGRGGVSVLMKPLPEATTMETWSFLKGSMSRIGDEVREIMSVRNDMAMLQKDLQSQEKMWHNAEIELKQENAKLKADLKRLESQVKQGAKIKAELMKTKQALEEEKRDHKDLLNEAEMQAKERALELEYYNKHRINQTALQKKVNETASKEVSEAEAVQLQLHKEAATLRITINGFQDKIDNGRKEMAFEDAKSKAEQAELRKQIVSMKEGLKRIQGKLKPRSIFEQQNAQLKHELRRETDVILGLQSEYQQIVTECTKMMEQANAVKCAENAKLKTRSEEKTQFCNAVQVQHQVLQQDMSKCALITGIQGPPVVQAPSPAMGPVALRDAELHYAPAPAFA